MSRPFGEATLLSLPAVGRGVPPSRPPFPEATREFCMHFVTIFLQFTGFRKSGGYGKILGSGQIGKEYPMNKAESSDGSATMAHTEPAGNQIVVYQPNGVMKIDVRFDGETVWLLQAQIAELFSCSLENVRLHLKNIYACGELEKTATSKESLEVRKEGNRSVTRKFLYYNLDAIISIGYRVNSIVGVRFRQWATQIIKERMFAGAALAAQFAAIDRRLLSHEKDIVELKDKVDFFVQTQTPPLQGVFYDGQLWDARCRSRDASRNTSAIKIGDSAMHAIVRQGDGKFYVSAVFG